MEHLENYQIMINYLLNSRDNITEELIEFYESNLGTYEIELNEMLDLEYWEDPDSLENIAIKILYLYDLDHGLL